MERTERTLEDVVETLKRAKERQKKCSLLIGAGCSVKAGVPTAGGFVKTIREKYPRAYERSASKTYASCMGELAVAERRDLIAGFVDKARINWAHICIAQLMKHGYVDRVLTTNFDLLLARACALAGLYPAIYDFAASQLYKPAEISDQAIIHLHGQRTGFVLMNTDEEVKSHSDLMQPVFQDAGLGRVWMVVGYSGDNDPVFGHLARVPRFDNILYWIGYKDDGPSAHVREQLLEQPKDAYFVGGHDADSFLVRLTQALRCFPPEFASRPFSHLDSLLAGIVPYSLPDQNAEVDVTSEARTWIQSAIKQFEDAESPRESEQPGEDADLRKSREVQIAFMSGEYDKVISLASKPLLEKSPEARESVSWAHVMLGVGLARQAEGKTGEEADRLFAQAGEKHQAALEIKPDKHEALYNWGNALSEQAKRKTGEEANRLFAQAGEKYQAALEIKPDDHYALNNRGNVLSEQGKGKTGEEADRLFAQAVEKYQAALRIKPDKHEALSNWGAALSEQGKGKTGEEADRLFAQAGEKCQAALEIKPDKHEAFNNWGNALIEQGKRKTGAEAESFFSKATEKLLKAEEIQPGSGAYNLACIAALKGDSAEARKWLEKSHELGDLPDARHLLEDTDLQSVRDEDWFQELLRARGAGPA